MTFRDLGERLNPGDDHPGEEVDTWSSWGQIGLTHTDPDTGRRVAGPCETATAEATARWATVSPPPPPAPDATDEEARDAATQDEAQASDPRRPRLFQAPEETAMAGPFRRKDIQPPTGWTRRDWARHIRERYANGHNIPPF